jgi:hypothetical protein
MRLGEEHMRANLQDQRLVFAGHVKQLDQRLWFQQLSRWNGRRASRENRGELRSDLRQERENGKSEKSGSP